MRVCTNMFDSLVAGPPQFSHSHGRRGRKDQLFTCVYCSGEGEKNEGLKTFMGSSLGVWG